jgi:tRNA threonylcarbamoyladenosine biosynthesis protein TsaE
MQVKNISTLEELHALAAEVIASCGEKNTATVIALRGDLGAGKTAFTKELASLLDIEESITSPTFVIMKSYTIPHHAYFKTLTHIDAYRIESDDEMRVLGFKELLSDPTRLICIEWPEKIESLIPEDAYPISINLHDTIRTITYGN